jgi:hypothetical protein
MQHMFKTRPGDLIVVASTGATGSYGLMRVLAGFAENSFLVLLRALVILAIAAILSCSLLREEGCGLRGARSSFCASHTCLLHREVALSAI